MAGYAILPVLGAVLPDGTTNNAAPRLQRVKSSAAAPAPHFVEAAFDAATDQHLSWVLQLPGNYNGSPVLRLHWKANATSGNVVWGCRIAATTPADADTPNEHAFGTANTATTGVNTTEARRLVETAITLSNVDSMAAGDTIIVQAYRDADNGSDTCTVDAELVSATLEFATS